MEIKVDEKTVEELNEFRTRFFKYYGVWLADYNQTIIKLIEDFYY